MDFFTFGLEFEGREYLTSVGAKDTGERVNILVDGRLQDFFSPDRSPIIPSEKGGFIHGIRSENEAKN